MLRFLVPAFLLFSVVSLTAQVTSTPYSRYGIGDFQFNGITQNMALGGGGIAIRCDSINEQNINILNPASFSAHTLVTYDVGLQSNTVQLSSSASSSISNRTTLSHITMAFPITKWWGGAFGLIPYSAVGYNVSQTVQRDSIGEVTNKYQGSGGVNQVFLGNSFRPFASLPEKFLISSKYDKLEAAHDSCGIYKSLKMRRALSNISVGANVSYLFGSLNNVRRDVFDDSLSALNTKITRKTVFKDAYASFGVQYRFHLWKQNPDYEKDALIRRGETPCANRYRIRRRDADGVERMYEKPIRVRRGIDVSLGAVFALPMDVTVNTDLLGQTYQLSGNYEIIRDTVINQADQFATIRIPGMVGLGFALIKETNWMFHGDFVMQQWKNFELFGTPAGLRNSMRATAGFQWTPVAKKENKNYRGMTYRAGLRYNQTYLELNNQALNEIGLTMGVTLPVFKGKTYLHGERINLGLDIGHRGTTDKNLISENYIRVMFSMTINDRWFVRPQFD